MNENIFKTKTDLDPSESKKLFGDPFWNEQGSSKARNFYLQQNEREKALMLKKNYLEMIKKARERNYNMAADCLQWWLDGTGFTKNIDVNWLRGNNEVIVAENVNIERFEERLELENFDKKLIKNGDFAEYENELQRQFVGGVFRELYYVCGTSTITSKANFKITRVKDNFVLSGTIIHYWWDRYDWHRGANAYINGFGYVDDLDALLVEKHCGARPYEMRSKWQQNFNKTFQSGFFWRVKYKIEIEKMKKKTYIGLTVLIILFSVYYYWQNRYVELRPVLVNENLSEPVLFSEMFHNQLFKIAKPNEIPPNFYKNIKWVLEREHQEYIVKNGVIYIQYKYMNDYEMIWNHTTKTNNLEWFKSQRRMDSINGEYKNTEELDRIIKGFSN